MKAKELSSTIDTFLEEFKIGDKIVHVSSKTSGKIVGPGETIGKKHWFSVLWKGHNKPIDSYIHSDSHSIVEVAQRADINPKSGEQKYGDVSYADERNKKYPINTHEHVRAALSYWGMPKNRSKYSAEDQKSIGAKIHAAAKKFGIHVNENFEEIEDEYNENQSDKELETHGWKDVSGTGIYKHPEHKHHTLTVREKEVRHAYTPSLKELRTEIKNIPHSDLRKYLGATFPRSGNIVIRHEKS